MCTRKASATRNPWDEGLWPFAVPPKLTGRNGPPTSFVAPWYRRAAVPLSQECSGAAFGFARLPDGRFTTMPRLAACWQGKERTYRLHRRWKYSSIGLRSQANAPFLTGCLAARLGESLRQPFGLPPPFHKGGDMERRRLRHLSPLVKGGWPALPAWGIPRIMERRFGLCTGRRRGTFQARRAWGSRSRARSSAARKQRPGVRFLERPAFVKAEGKHGCTVLA